MVVVVGKAFVFVLVLVVIVVVAVVLLVIVAKVVVGVDGIVTYLKSHVRVFWSSFIVALNR